MSEENNLFPGFVKAVPMIRLSDAAIKLHVSLPRFLRLFLGNNMQVDAVLQHNTGGFTPLIKTDRLPMLAELFKPEDDQ